MARGFGLVLLAIGCGGGDDEGAEALRSCDQSDIDGDCVTFSGTDWTSADVADSCDAGELVADCPAANAVGTCTIDEGSTFETRSTFYSPYWNASTAASACGGSGGSWAVAR